MIAVFSIQRASVSFSEVVIRNDAARIIFTMMGCASFSSLLIQPLLHLSHGVLLINPKLFFATRTAPVFLDVICIKTDFPYSRAIHLAKTSSLDSGISLLLQKMHALRLAIAEFQTRIPPRTGGQKGREIFAL